MVESFGYDLADMSVKLFLSHETHVGDVIESENKEVLRLADQMEDLEKFLALVKKRTDQESQRVDLQDAHERDLVDRLRGQEELKHIFDTPNQYTWKGKADLENLSKLAQDYVTGPLQQKIARSAEKMVMEENKLTEVLSLFKAGHNRMERLIQEINSNIMRIH